MLVNWSKILPVGDSNKTQADAEARRIEAEYLSSRCEKAAYLNLECSNLLEKVPCAHGPGKATFVFELNWYQAF